MLYALHVRCKYNQFKHSTVVTKQQRLIINLLIDLDFRTKYLVYIWCSHYLAIVRIAKVFH